MQHAHRYEHARQGLFRIFCISGRLWLPRQLPHLSLVGLQLHLGAHCARPAGAARRGAPPASLINVLRATPAPHVRLARQANWFLVNGICAHHNLLKGMHRRHVTCQRASVGVEIQLFAAATALVDLAGQLDTVGTSQRVKRHQSRVGGEHRRPRLHPCSCVKVSNHAAQVFHHDVQARERAAVPSFTQERHLRCQYIGKRLNSTDARSSGRSGGRGQPRWGTLWRHGRARALKWRHVESRRQGLRHFVLHLV